MEDKEIATRLLGLLINDGLEDADLETVKFLREAAERYGFDVQDVTPFDMQEFFPHVFYPREFVWHGNCNVPGHQQWIARDPRESPAGRFTILEETEHEVRYSDGQCQTCGRRESLEVHTS